MNAPLPALQQLARRLRGLSLARSLRRDLLAGLLAAFLFFFLVAQVIRHYLLVANFEAYELEQAEMLGERLLATLDFGLRHLERSALDWANWDDTHDFLNGRNPGFVDDNLGPGVLVNLDANLIALVDADGRERVLQSVRSKTGQPIETPPEILRLIAPGGAWLEAHRADKPQRGYVATEIGVLAFVAVPVHRSSGPAHGPSAGTFVIGRYLNKELVEQLQAGTRTALEVYDLTAPDLPAELGRAAAALGTRQVLARPLDDGRLGVYAALRDLWQQPVGLLRVVEPRRGVALARQSGQRALLARIIVAALFIAFFLWLIDRRMIKRLHRLDAALQDAIRGDGAARVPDLGFDDELTNLGRRINGLLEELESRQDAREARDAVMTASRMKSDFLATLSEEIRQPLNGVLGALESALERESSPTVRARLDDAYRSANGLVALLNDALDFSGLGPAPREPEAREFDLRTLFEDIAALFAPRAAQHGLVVNCFVDPKLARLYRGDQRRLRQVLANLVDNAIKFTLRGEVTLRVSLMGRRATEDSIVLSVIDSGIGFSPGQISSLFERGDDARRGLRPGGGLGLAVARQIVTQLGGLIDVESELGEGSRISAALRLQRMDEGSIGLFDQHAGRRALLLGPDTTCAEILADYLTAMGVVVTRLADPADAIGQQADFAVLAAPAADAVAVPGTLPVIAVLPPGSPPGPLGGRILRITWPVQLHALQRAVGDACNSRADGEPDVAGGI